MSYANHLYGLKMQFQTTFESRCSQALQEILARHMRVVIVKLLVTLLGRQWLVLIYPST